jgi:SAM-dependent methyltransferase
MTTINSPLFSFTSDVDWASEYCIRDLSGLLASFQVKPTLFVTHESAVIADLAAAGKADLGVHPNFAPGSSHGDSIPEVIDSVFRLVPSAETYRAHRFVDSTTIGTEMERRGIRYDSNLCLHMQAGLEPLQHATGVLRYPVFFEDDVNWMRAPGDWRLDLEEFITPGLKILNFHPFFVAANIPSFEYYQSIKSHISTVDETTIEEIRYRGEGTRTFLERLLEALAARSERFYTLKELHHMLRSKSARATASDAGRHTAHSDEEHARYWSLTDREKQEFLKTTYEQRDPLDPWATSRDTQVRSLEIAALRRGFTTPGRVLDVGCGNGFTLLTLGETLEGFTLQGVDFVEKLVGGAIQLRDARRDQLRSVPEFLCADAIEYLKTGEPGSVDYVITARFLQNMPSAQVQRDLIAAIYRILAPGGRLLMCEGSEDGFEALNDLRQGVGLDRIPATSADNVSALRFKDGEIEAYATGLGFSLQSKLGFSQFFIMARVLHPLLVQPQRPRFDARINELAKEIQSRLPFEPGCGSNTLWILEK